MGRRLCVLVVALGLLGSFGVTSVLAAGIVVSSLVDAAADDGVCTLREAITAANMDTASGAMAGECAAGSGTDAITFALGGTITLTSALPAIWTNLSITGAGAITISGASAFRVLHVNGSTVQVSGLTITAGSGGSGGGILITVGTLSLTDSTISGNTADLDGGGIFNGHGLLAITNSTISGNTAGLDGGGIGNSLGWVTVTNSTIGGNTTTRLGGGIDNGGGSVAVTNSTISGNTAGLNGGGIDSIHGRVTVTNSTISGNHAERGGGIFDDFGAMTATNSTISGNTGSLSGGGITTDGPVTNETIVNTIIAGNTAPAGPDIDFTAQTITTITTSVIGVPAGMSLADILVPAGLANNGGPTQTIALALVAGNPAIDTATGAVCVASPVGALDQRGVARPAACDIGAYEAGAPTVAAHANVDVAPTSAAGAVVSYTAPAGTNERGGVAPVVCAPVSGSTFPLGTTTVTCTATDPVGHTGTGTFQVTVAVMAAPPTASPIVPTTSLTATPAPPTPTMPPTDVATTGGTTGTPGLVLILGFLGLLSVAVLRRPSIGVPPR